MGQEDFLPDSFFEYILNFHTYTSNPPYIIHLRLLDRLEIHFIEN